MEASSERERTLPGRGLTRFTALLQEGVRVRAGSGESVHAFLTERLGIAAEYVAGRISTVFLDGQVVDDVHAATLSDGSLLALSAAEPSPDGSRRGDTPRREAEPTDRPTRIP